MDRQQVLLRQQARLQRRIAALRQSSIRLSWARVAAFFGGIVLSFIAFLWSAWAGWASILLALIIFGVLVAVHRRFERSIAAHQRLQEIVETETARVNLDWAHIPPPLDLPAQPEHPFAIDLDIVGDRSLHQLLDCATTREGSLRLSDWMLQPLQDKEQIEARQTLVRELIPLTAFRHKLSVNARLAMKRGVRRWSVQPLLAWAAVPDKDSGLKSTLLLLTGLAILNAALFILYQLGALPALWAISFLVYLGLIGARYRESSALFGEAMGLQDVLEQAGSVFRHLETFGYSSTPELKVRCSPILIQRPSVSLRRVRRIVAAVGLQHNVVLWGLINAVVPWDVFFAYQLRRERKALAALLPRWIDVWLELEALSSLATFAYLNPDAVFPKVAETGELFIARTLGHPLIPITQRVCNDFEIKRMGDVAIITGSNMSGKSSFLRTLGVNLCLAYAGAPVIAAQFDVALFRLFTCIRVSDSLADGISYFYAEVRRLKALLGALEEESMLPLFFLIDEIFRGTNNRERLIGSRSYIQALVGKNGVGVISTHDLELVKLEEELDQITNYHFEDRVLDGRMEFDYVLRPGPSPTTNALKIMRQVGLPILET
ncbi:MAG TPA: hypothetical protein VK003_19510 [Oceanobacillus sp.]|nr:hypothetical protein [Oceanobacillus sp.]